MLNHSTLQRPIIRPIGLQAYAIYGLKFVKCVVCFPNHVWDLFGIMALVTVAATSSIHSNVLLLVGTGRTLLKSDAEQVGVRQLKSMLR